MIESRAVVPSWFRATCGAKADVEAMIAAVIAESGRLDCLVNNAWSQTWASLLDLTEADWVKTIRTKLKGSFSAPRRRRG